MDWQLPRTVMPRMSTRSIKLAAMALTIASVLTLGLSSSVSAQNPAPDPSRRTIETAHEYVRFALGRGTASYYLPIPPGMNERRFVISSVQTSGCSTAAYGTDSRGETSSIRFNWSEVTDLLHDYVVHGQGVGVVGPIRNSITNTQDGIVFYGIGEMERLDAAFDFIKQHCDRSRDGGF
jgi:hypothetical protein